MSMKLFELFDYDKRGKIVNRNFSNQLLLDNNFHESLKINGYVHIKNVIVRSEIEILKKIFLQYKNHNGFEHVNYYTNTIGFFDHKIRVELKSATDNILYNILKRIYNINKTFFPLGGGFAVNPAFSNRGCLPHQDPTFVDEDKTFSTTTWLGLEDTTIENGCLWALNGSHIWGNKYRSVRIPWKFNNCIDQLWDLMTPIPINAGDILCFDVALIHASKMNITAKDRLAMTVQAFPTQETLLSYHPNGKYFVDEYIIDGDYFIKESQYEKPSKKYKKRSIFTSISNYKPEDVIKLNKQYLEIFFNN